MGWLVIRIEEKAGETCPESERPPPVEILRARHALRDPAPARIHALAEANGYDIAPVLYSSAQGLWPLTGVVYTSRNRDGHGRVGSSIQRLPVRRSG